MLVYAAVSAAASDGKQLPLPPSKVRTWQLPGLPANGAFLRVMECQYAHVRTLSDGHRGYAPGWKGVTSPDSRMPRLQSCIGEEMSQWYHGVPATWIKPDISSLWYSYTDVLQADGEPQGKTGATYPSSRLIGFVLSPNVTVDAAFPHDTWSVQPISKYSLCNKSHSAGHSSEDYAKVRFANLRQHCDMLSKIYAHKKRKQQNKEDDDTANDDDDDDNDIHDLEMQTMRWPVSWIRDSGETCHHGSSMARAEADQRAFLRLVSASRTLCDPGPMYNQAQVRYNVGMITGIFHTPELRVEAEMVRSAIGSLARAFGRQQNIDMLEAKWIGAESESEAHKKSPMQPWIGTETKSDSAARDSDHASTTLEPVDWMAEEARLGHSTIRGLDPDDSPTNEGEDDDDDEQGGNDESE